MGVLGKMHLIVETGDGVYVVYSDKVENIEAQMHPDRAELEPGDYYEKYTISDRRTVIINYRGPGPTFYATPKPAPEPKKKARPKKK